MSISHLTPTSAKPDDDTVRLLKVALAMAEAGELRDFSLVGTLAGGDCYTAYSAANTTTALGQLDVLKHRMLMSVSSFPMSTGDD